jgi:hypothetical protein
MSDRPGTDAARFCDSVTVSSATSTSIVPRSPGRRELTIVNDGTNTVYLRLATTPGVDPVAALGKGIRLNSGGGSWSTEDYCGPVHAIASTADTSVTVTDV